MNDAAKNEILQLIGLKLTLTLFRQLNKHAMCNDMQNWHSHVITVRASFEITVTA